jgi:hypothetical protein
MYALLKDEPLDEATEEANPAEMMVKTDAGATRRLRQENTPGVFRLHHNR